MMRKIWLVLMLTICISTTSLPILASQEDKTKADWDSFVGTLNTAFETGWKDLKAAIEEMKDSNDLEVFIERIKTSTNNEYEALNEYQEQFVGEEGSNQRFIQDSYMDGIKVLWEASQEMKEEDFTNFESEFWDTWRKGRNERYDVIMELFYYLDDTDLDENMVQEIHDKYYEDMILKDDTDAIKQLQKSLGVLDDGDIGPGTLGTLKRWQKENGKEIRGIISEKMLNEINR